MRLQDFVNLTEKPTEPWRLAQGKNISMPGELWGRVDVVADALDVSRSVLVRQLVESAIEDLERDLAEVHNEADYLDDEVGDHERAEELRESPKRKSPAKKADSQVDIEELTGRTLRTAALEV